MEPKTAPPANEPPPEDSIDGEAPAFAVYPKANEPLPDDVIVPPDEVFPKATLLPAAETFLLPMVILPANVLVAVVEVAVK